MATNLIDRNVIVTGGTDGIGLATASELASMGATLWIVGRNEEKTIKAVEEIRKSSSNEKVGYLIADLSKVASIKILATSIARTMDRLDVLVNNAGAIFLRRELNSDGLEMTLALNHVNYFLLTNLLMDLLRNGTHPRIVNVSSAAHYSGRIDFSDLQSNHHFSPMRVYSNSKLMNVLFTYELVRRMDGKGITANALHPGFVASNFGKSNGGIMKPLFGLFQLGAINVSEGAKTSVYLASSSEVEGVTGKYFDKRKSVKSSKDSYDLTIAGKLWDETEKLINTIG